MTHVARAPSAVIRYADLPAVPWRNGLGVTREVASARDDLDFLWRVSIADVVAAGPFSRFKGVDRVLLVASGSGLILDIDGHEHQLGLHESAAFSGESATSARLIDGPTQDLNLMARRGAAEGRVVVKQFPASAVLEPPAAGATCLLIALTPVEAQVGAERLSLDRLDAVGVDSRLVFTVPATVAVIAIAVAETHSERKIS